MSNNEQPEKTILEQRTEAQEDRRTALEALQWTFELTNGYTDADFCGDIYFMNKMYELPTSHTLLTPTPERIKAFKDILAEEVEELDAVMKAIENGDHVKGNVGYADLLADVIVFATSEACRHGIPIFSVLENVMDSNFTKLGEDGKPIKDERGKFLKGPNYQPPEKAIETTLYS